MKTRLALTALIMLAVAGCGLISRPPAIGPGACPAPAAETLLLRNEAHGYCLLYPADYSLEQPNPNETVLFMGSLLNVDAGRAYLEVTNAGGRAAPEVAGQIIRDFAATLPDWGIKQSTIDLGGETAIVLDNLPGQDINRQVVAVHGGRLYLFTFAPADPAQTGPYEEMERLYKAAVESFRFTP